MSLLYSAAKEWEQKPTCSHWILGHEVSAGIQDKDCKEACILQRLTSQIQHPKTYILKASARHTQHTRIPVFDLSQTDSPVARALREQSSQHQGLRLHTQFSKISITTIRVWSHALCVDCPV